MQLTAHQEGLKVSLLPKPQAQLQFSPVVEFLGHRAKEELRPPLLEIAVLGIRNQGPKAVRHNPGVGVPQRPRDVHDGLARESPASRDPALR